MVYKEDVTKFDPDQKYLYKQLPTLRKSFSKYRSDVAEKAYNILSVLENKNCIDILCEASDWLLENVTIKNIGENKFIGLFFVLGSLMVNEYQSTSRDERLVDNGLSFIKKCEGLVDDETFHYNIANAYAELHRIEKESGNQTKAHLYLREARNHQFICLDINPDKPEALANLANNYLQTGRELEAIELCNKAIRVKPDNQMAYSLKGEMLLQIAFNKHQILDAIDCLENAWAFPGKMSRVAARLGFAYEEIGELDKAERIYRECLELSEDIYTEYSKQRLEIIGKLKK